MPILQRKHGEKEMCDENLKAKKFMFKHIKYMTNKSHKYTMNRQCSVAIPWVILVINVAAKEANTQSIQQ